MTQHAEDTPNWLGISAKEAWKDIGYGSIAGMVAEVFEYPFDLAKVRLQSQLLHFVKGGSTPIFNGPLDCLNQTWKEEGLRGLYRGLSVPLVGSMAHTAGLFLAYSSFQRAIQNYYHPHSNRNGDHGKVRLTIPQIGLASAGAGFLTSFILTPMELVKCRMQVQMMNTHAQHYSRRSTPFTSRTIPKFFSSTRPAAPKPAFTAPKSALHNSTITRTPFPQAWRMASLPSPPPHGVELPGIFSIVRSIFLEHRLKGFWLGQAGMIVRETGGSAVWFIAKEAMANALRERREGSQFNKEASGPSHLPEGAGNIMPWESAIAGATAGAVATLLLYPVDTIKSVIQTEEELRPSSHRVQATNPNTFWRAASKMYRAHGLRSFYSGCGMTVAISVPSSGIIFVIYDGLSQWFDKD